MKVSDRTDLERENMTGENHGGNANRPVNYLTASSIIGNKVFSHLDEDLGEIKEIMLDINNGSVEYLVLEYGGGFLGMKSKLFAIPFGSLRIDTKRHAFILNQSKDVLEKAPGFDKDHWPETNAHLNDSSAYWGGFMGSNTGAVPY